MMSGSEEKLTYSDAFISPQPIPATTLEQPTPPLAATTSPHSSTGDPTADISKIGRRNRRRNIRVFHRIAAVRKQQGISLRTAARHLGKDITGVRLQEDPNCDLRISELQMWQKLLDVPLTDLLVDPGHGLSAPVLERARMLRIMKTVVTIRERATTPAIQRLAEMLFEQIVDLMPDLKDVPAWHSVGKRRGLDEFGRAVERRISEDQLFGFPLSE